jgi:DNA polymerase-3 subunit chi
MKQADFYVLPQADIDSRYRFMGKLVTRALGAGHRIYILTDSQSEAETIHERLWHSEAESFLPSKLITQEGYSPIEIGWDEAHTPKEPDLLMNLSVLPKVPSDAFSRVTEIVIQQDTVLEITRARFKDYQSQGWKTSLHDMRRS